MTRPFAEVIGDPVAQTRSPAIHRRWLGELGLQGDYCASRVAAAELAGFLDRRRRDPLWRGCNVTIPHKERVLPLLDRIDGGAAAIGAVNCILPGSDGLTGRNTDIDGVGAALAHARLAGRKAALIGAGGGARAALQYLVDAGAAEIVILAREPRKAAHFRRPCPAPRIEVVPLEEPDAAFAGAAAIVNATPMGMAGAAAMPERLLASLAVHTAGATLLDMVCQPLETPFLAVGRANGAAAVDGLVMLVGQAKAAFRFFFGREPPADDDALRAALTGGG